MIQGVTSLRCPACGQPFLTLPQAAQARVTCPHCARSAPMASYPPAGQGARGMTQPLPLRRRESGPRSLAGAAGVFTSGGQTQEDSRTSPAWPAAPEQPAPQGAWGAAQVSPFGISPPEVVMPADTWPAPMAAYFQPAPEPPSETLPPASASWPQTVPRETQSRAWPGLEVAATPFAQVPFEPVPQPPLPLPAAEPRKRAPAVAAVLLLLVSCASAWLAWEESRQAWAVDFPLPERPQSTTSGAPDQTLETPAPALPAAPAGPEPEIRRAQVPDKTDIVALSPTPELLEQTESLLRALFEVSDPAARLALLAAPEEHEVEVAGFFANGAPKLRSLSYANATPRLLPGGQPVPLFQVVTDRCPGGALLRLAPLVDGTPRLDWPLFAETHERRLARYLENKPDEPGWFHVGMRRSHGLDLSESVRAGHLAYDLQGSADGSVRCLAVAARETPLGRFLEREAGWEGVHLARLLLHYRQTADAGAVLHILDCEGARMGASNQGSDRQ